MEENHPLFSSNQKDESAETLTGAAYVKAHLPVFPLSPGVYRMLNAAGKILYVGKAKCLRKRLENYASPERCCMRIQKMISQIAHIEVVETETEAEAFLLENDFIKRLKPHYNILLKDDKTFPHILMTTKAEWPQILKHRGAKREKGAYFGPFASGMAVNETLTVLQKAFLLRSCSDSVFYHRTRPCLMYQIKRCCGPCAGKIEREKYLALVGEACDFMKGKSTSVQKMLEKRMDEASAAMRYEEAAVLRDRIRALNEIQRHSLDSEAIPDGDVMAIFEDGGLACVQVLFFRAGRGCGSYAYFLPRDAEKSSGEVLQAFVGQFYQSHTLPKEIVTNISLPDAGVVEEALSRKDNIRVRVTSHVRGARKKLVDRAVINARESLARYVATQGMRADLFDKLQLFLNLDASVERVEAYDNSHIQGTSAVGVMIAATRDGFDKKLYRRFNIDSEKVTPGDDYGMMREVLTRRFRRGLTENNLPDVIFIDGGKNQLAIAFEVLDALGISSVTAVGVAKGEDRNAGRETLFFRDRPPAHLDFDDPILHFIQRLRDESHRFAVGSHRIKRTNAMLTSGLDSVEGIGAKKKQALLCAFGSVRAVREASVGELCRVEGISVALAEKIKAQL